MSAQASKTGPSPDRILQLGLGFWGSKALLSAVELGLFTELGKGPIDLNTISKRLGLHPRGAADFLDALVSLGMLEREDGLYANSTETGAFLDRSNSSYVGGILEMANTRLYPAWGSLTEALRTGEPQNEVKNGPNLFQQLYSDPARLRGFAAAMTGVSKGTAHALAAKFPWRDYRTFADIGCAQGGVPVVLAQSHAHLSGIGFDLAQLQPIFEEYVAAAGLQDRLRFQPGDMMAGALPDADVLIFGHILHDWDLERKRAILEKAYGALRPGGAIIVYDSMIDDGRRLNTFGLLMSLNMLVETPGGFDYTGSDCAGWLRDAGFTQIGIEPLVGPHSMAVGIKP
jgi:SAM-dependent methyltransferase